MDIEERKKAILAYGELDVAAIDGCYTSPLGANETNLDIRALVDYCRQHGKGTEDLTDDEIRLFVI